MMAAQNSNSDLTRLSGTILLKTVSSPTNDLYGEEFIYPSGESTVISAPPLVPSPNPETENRANLYFPLIAAAVAVAVVAAALFARNRQKKGKMHRPSFSSKDRALIELLTEMAEILREVNRR